jgi:hypothetical protein
LVAEAKIKPTLKQDWMECPPKIKIKSPSNKANAQLSEPKEANQSPYLLLHIKLSLFKFSLYKFFVVYKIQPNQKNYNF